MISRHVFSDVNTFGTSASMSLILDTDAFGGSGAVAYQFHADDSSSIYDKQHMLKLGVTARARLGRDLALTLFGTWSVSTTWKCTGGYKKSAWTALYAEFHWTTTTR
jgi:hypothetical protein